MGKYVARSRSEMPQEVFNLLNKEITTVVIATVDEDGSPRTAPFHWLAAKDKRTIMVAINPHHSTFENIKRDGNVMVCILEEGNTAISIKGQAHVIKESMDNVSWRMAVVEINVDDVKSDVSPVGNVVSGVRVEINDKYRLITREVFNELKETP